MTGGGHVTVQEVGRQYMPGCVFTRTRTHAHMHTPTHEIVHFIHTHLYFVCVCDIYVMYDIYYVCDMKIIYNIYIIYTL